MSGIENIIGYGKSQILPKPASMMPLVEQLNQQRQQKFARERYDQQQKEQNDKELYGLVGDALNLRDFNPVIHDRVRQAQVQLAQKLKSEKPSYGDAYIAAQNKASELGVLSQSLNQADQVIAAQKKEWEGDKRINAAQLEGLARKDILEDLQKNGKIDPNVNYMNRALRKYPKYALTDNGEFAQHKFLPEELQKGLSGKYKATNKRGAVDQFDWKVGDFAPSFYDFKDNGEDAAPTITTKAEESGLVDADKKPIPMLSEDAWGRYGAVTSNVIDLDRRLLKKYGQALDLESDDAEILRRIEAFKEVEKMKPKVSQSRVEKEAPIKYVSNTNINMNNNPQIDLREYPDAPGGGKNITSMLQDINVVSLVTGKSFGANQVIYNPSTKRIKFTEPVTNKEEEMSLTTFLQNLRPQNPAADIKWLREGLNNPITGNKPTGMVTVVLANGTTGQIPADKVDLFLKENKGSKRQ